MDIAFWLLVFVSVKSTFWMFLAFYCVLKFKRAQVTAESLYFLASEGCTSYDNGVRHSGICEGEVMAAAVLENARQVLMSLPGRGDYFREMWQGVFPF